jgi:3-deoxy-D-manno-octulosonate 8-phosphate phosphatase (KDO 8-P phosphatase)
MKTFCVKDWTAIKRFRAIGINVVFLSGDETINRAVAKSRKLPFYLSRQEQVTIPKEKFLNELSNVYNCKPEEMVYLGDDLFDIGIMKVVGHSYCTSDSPNIVKLYSKPIPASGGNNAVMVLFDMLEEENKIQRVPIEQIMQRIMELDESEKF